MSVTTNQFKTGMAIRHKLSAHDLKKSLWAYPTYVSDIKYMI